MDLKTLLTIVVTAIVTAVVKEFATGIVTWTKNSRISNSITTALRPFLNRFFVAVAFDCVGLAAMTAIATNVFSSDAPATRFDLLTLFALCFGLVFFAGSLAHDYFAFVLHRAITSTKSTSENKANDA